MKGRNPHCINEVCAMGVFATFAIISITSFFTLTAVYLTQQFHNLLILIFIILFTLGR